MLLRLADVHCVDDIYRKKTVCTSRSVALAYLESLAYVGRQAPGDHFLIRIGVPDRVWERALRAKEKDRPRTWRLGNMHCHACRR